MSVLWRLSLRGKQWDGGGILQKRGTETGLHASGLQYSQWKICNYLRHSDWTNKKHSRGLAGHVLSCRTAEWVLNLSLTQQHSGWEPRPRYEPSQNTNEILIISLVCQKDEPGQVPTGRPVSGLRKKERESETDRMRRPWPLLSVERERDRDSEGGGEIKREKKSQSPLTLVLRQSSTGTHHSDLLWPMTVLLNSFPPISRQEVLWLPHTAQLSSAWETN